MTEEPTTGSATDAPPAAAPSAPAAAPPGAQTPDQAVPTAPPPVGAPPAAWVSALLCLALVGLGLVLLRELLVDREVAGQVLVPGGPWLAPLLASATAVVQGTAAALAGVAGVVLGFLLVVAAVGSRPRRSVRLAGRHPLDVPVDLDGQAVAALAADAALADPEVGTSRASAGRRLVVVDVSVDPRDAHDEAALAGSLTQRVQERLADLDPQPRVRVRVHGAVPR